MKKILLLGVIAGTLFISHLGFIPYFYAGFALLIVFMFLYFLNDLKLEEMTSNYQLRNREEELVVATISYQRFLFFIIFIMLIGYSIFLLYLIRWLVVLGDFEQALKYGIGFIIAIAVGKLLVFRKHN